MSKNARNTVTWLLIGTGVLFSACDKPLSELEKIPQQNKVLQDTIDLYKKDFADKFFVLFWESVNFKLDPAYRFKKIIF